MKKIFYSMALAIAVVLAGSCNSVTDGPGSGKYTDCFINQYYYYITGFESAWISDKATHIILADIHTTYYKGSSLFDYYKERYNDNHYDRITYEHYYSTGCNEFIKMDVVSDSDFDGEHPAGTSLADVMRLASSSPYKYIQSGYDEEYFFNWNTDDVPEDYYLYYSGVDEYICIAGTPGFSPVNKYLNELIPEDMLMLEELAFTFAKQPTLSKEHNLTFTIQDTQRTMTLEVHYVAE